MIVYVESNFVFEHGLLREEHEACEALLDLARIGRVRLVLPAFSVGEPYEAWVRRKKKRTELQDRIISEIKELARSKPYADLWDQADRLVDVLVESEFDERARIDRSLAEIVEVAEVIPLGASVLLEASASEKTLRLSPQDALVFASVVEHLSDAGPGQKCFITRNAQDFNTSPIRARLAEHGCRLLTRFADGLGYARSR